MKRPLEKIRVYILDCLLTSNHTRPKRFRELARW